MTIKELLINYKDMELTEEQEKQIKEYLGIKESKKWKPEKEEIFYFVNTCGEIYKDVNNKFKIFTNNCFKTEEDAKYRLEQIKVYNELKNFADENNDETDWNDCKVEKYVIEYDLENKELYCDWYTCAKSIGQIYFSSRELAYQAIEKVGAERIKKYLFGVWDNE